MLVNAFYGTEKPHPVLAQTDVGDWILQIPAIWNRHEEPLQAAFDTHNDEHIGNVCRAILEEIPNHLDALTQLAYLALEEGNPEQACHWSTQAYEACQQTMVDGFDPLAEEVSWGFINNRPFHRALYAHANVLCELGRSTEAKKLLRALLFMNPNDNLGVRYHELVSQSAVRESEKRARDYERRGKQHTADLNGKSVEEMDTILALAEAQLNQHLFGD